MPIEYIIYIPIALLLTIYFLAKAKNRAFVTLFNLWLFGSPVFSNPKYVITLSFFGFDIQPNRLLFLVLTPILVLTIITPHRRGNLEDSQQPRRFPVFELAMIGYILTVIFTIGLNFRAIGARSAIADITNSIAFVVVYFCAFKFLGKDDFYLIKTSFLIFAVMSVIVALYQFLVNPDFFRLGVVRDVFAGYYRANGLFSAEYDQGLFLTLSMIVVMSMSFRLWMKMGLIAIFLAGGFVTMHRLSWIAMIIALGLIWFLYLKTDMIIYITVPLLLLLLLFGAINTPWSKMAIGQFGEKLIADRVLSDTLSIRISQYKFSFFMMQQYPLGIGDYSTSLYLQKAYNHGLTYGGRPWNSTQMTAYIIHNGFLSAGVRYGIFGMFLYSLFLLTSLYEFLKNSIQKGKDWYPLLMIVVIFLIFNATNDFSFLGNQIGVILAWLLGGYLSQVKHHYVSEPIIQPLVTNSLNHRVIDHAH